jgi:transcriptional regulator with XRE-family HTH domain
MLSMFSLSSIPEIARELGQRLRQLRLQEAMTQDELAARAGVSVRALRNLEANGQATLETFLKVTQALGRATDLDSILEVKVQSIREMELASRVRQRAPRSRREKRQ